MSAATGTTRAVAPGTGTPDPSQTNIPNASVNTSSLQNAESKFPQAAIIAVAVIGGLIALFAAYGFYRWIHKRSQHLRSSYRAPPSPTILSPGMQQTGGFGAASAVDAGARGKFSRMSSFQSTGSLGVQYPSLGAASTRSSMLGLDAPSPGISEASLANPTSPFMGGTTSGRSTPPRAVIRGDSSMSTDVLRAQGSRSSLLNPVNVPGMPRDRRSTMPNSHSQYSSTGSVGTSHMNGSNSSLLSPFATPRRPRVSGPPHARHSRVEIVPPTPLAPPPGTVVATDKTTLAFSALSGIGTDGSVMGLSGLVDPSPPGSATAASAPGSSDGASSVGASRWFNTPLAGSELDLAGRVTSPTSSQSGGSSGPASLVDAAAASKPVSTNSSTEDHLSSLPSSPVRMKHAQQNRSRAFSEATSASSAHVSDESSITGPVPPLPTELKGDVTPGPQSPLDKLKLELQGEARRAERRSANSSAANEGDLKGKGKERSLSGVLSQRDIEAYRRGESGPVQREP